VTSNLKHYYANLDLQLSIDRQLPHDPEEYPSSLLKDPSPLIAHLLKLNTPSFVYRLLFRTRVIPLLFQTHKTPHGEMIVHPALANHLDDFYYPDYEYLSDLQILCIQVLNNFLDASSPVSKLRMLNISQHQYLAWLNDSLFHNTYLTHLQVTAPKAKPTALNGLIVRALAGDPDSLKSVLAISSPSNLRFGPATHPTDISHHVHSPSAQRMLTSPDCDPDADDDDDAPPVVVPTNTETYYRATDERLIRPTYHYPAQLNVPQT
jgi:hypothetical protein